MKPTIVSITIVLCTLSGCGPSYQIKGRKMQEQSGIAVREAIDMSNALYWKAFTTADSSIFIGRYATDCCIMPPNTPALCGPDAAGNFYRIAYSMGIRNGRFVTQAVYDCANDYVAEQGLFELYDAKNTLIENGKYLVLWKKTDDGWKMYRDIFNSDRELGK